MRSGIIGATLVAGILQFASMGVVFGADSLKIGTISPLTGGGAPWGIAASEAAKIVAKDYNDKGGIDVGGKKYQIEVISYDDRYNAADSVAAYNRLVNQDGVKLMLIHTSPAAVALKQNVEDDEVVAITSAASPNAIDENSRFMFRIQNTPDDYMPALIGWLRDNLSEKRVVLLNPNDEVGWSFSKLAESLYEKNGFEVAGNELYDRSQNDFAPLFTKIIAEQPQVIDLGGIPPATTGLMIRQARELGYNGKFIKTAGPSPKEIVDAAGKDAVEGMLMVLFADPANPGFEHLESAYRTSIGQDPNEMIVPVYDGFSVLLRAVQKAGDIDDTVKIADAVRQVLPVKSVQGDELTLGDDASSGKAQQIVTTTYIGIIKGGVPSIIGKVK